MNQLIDKNPSNYHGVTPLHLAAKEGNGQICRLILDYVEDKNPEDNFGDTPNNLYLKASAEVDSLFESQVFTWTGSTLTISMSHLEWFILIVVFAMILAPFIVY